MISKYIEVFLIFLKLGFTSFGGPVAHLGYFHNEFVSKRKWLTEVEYSELVALCQLLPGPASSQVGMGLGLLRAGIFGSIIAWLGFTLPSAVILIFFGLGLTQFSEVLSPKLIHALKLVAVPIVAQAIWLMGKKFCSDKKSFLIAILSSTIAIFYPSAFSQIMVIIFGLLSGYFFLKKSFVFPDFIQNYKVTTKQGVVSLSAFFCLLLDLPLLIHFGFGGVFKIIKTYYLSGALVFGGGHVVLPLLQSTVVQSNGWVSEDVFMTGYGFVQSLPGPMFSFAAYLGTVAHVFPNGLFGGLIALASIFLPSFLLIVGILPFWEKIRNLEKIKTMMSGINASVVGLLLAAFYKPVLTNSVGNQRDVLLVILGLLLLMKVKVPNWIVIVIIVVLGSFL